MTSCSSRTPPPKKKKKTPKNNDKTRGLSKNNFVLVKKQGFDGLGRQVKTIVI